MTLGDLDWTIGKMGTRIMELLKLKMEMTIQLLMIGNEKYKEGFANLVLHILSNNYVKKNM